MNNEKNLLGNVIHAAGMRLCHVHACENNRGAPGSENVNWREVASALHDIGYEGPLVIESFTAKVESIVWAAAISLPLAESQDILAPEELAYLRKLMA